MTTWWFFSTRNFTKRVFLATLALLVVPMLASAQDTGYIAGTITDKSGATVAGADVTLTNVKGSITHYNNQHGWSVRHLRFAR